MPAAIDCSIEEDVLFFVFPDSAIGSGLTPDNAEALIKAKAFALFANLCGHAEKISSNSGTSEVLQT